MSDEDKLDEEDKTDTLAKMWRQLYNNLLREGFEEHEALELVKAFIMSLGQKRAF